MLTFTTEKNVRPLSSWVWITSFRMTVSSSITWKLHNFIFLTNIITIYCVVMHFYQLMDIWTSHLSWTVSWAAMSMEEQCLSIRVWSPLGKCPGVVQPDHEVDIMLAFWEPHTDVSSHCSSLHSSWHWISASLPTSSPAFVAAWFHCCFCFLLH